MDYTTILAVEINLDIDYDKIAHEILSVPDSYWIPSVYDGFQWKSLLLTKNSKAPFRDFKSAKLIGHSEWHWDYNIPTPYTRSILDSLPVDNIGIVRVMLTDGYLPLHTDCDTNTPDDKSYYIGLSLFPVLNDPLTVANKKLKCRSMLFNDKLAHGYPESISKNLTIRIFGDFDYSNFEIVKIHTLSNE
jgi:hypothetical protein